MSEVRESSRRRRPRGNGGKVQGEREGEQLSTVSMGHSSESELRPGGGTNGLEPKVEVPDPEVVARPERRRFNAKYKLQILEQVDACSEPGEVGRLLRREGLYSSHLTAWRKAQRAGSLKALEPKKRGRKAAERNPLQPKVDRLERQVHRLEEELRKAHVILDVQGKVAGLLGLNFDSGKNS